MEIISFILIELLYNIFLGIIVTKFNNIYLANSCFLLFLFSMIISLPSLILIRFIKNRKKYFIISCILIVLSSSLILLIRKFTKNGIINFTFHIYTILFMLIPFFSIFTLSLHKLSYPTQKKKQLILLIASKKIIIIFITFIFCFLLKFEKLIILISTIEFILNIISPFISSFLLKYQN